jgi:hypothetical protein
VSKQPFRDNQSTTFLADAAAVAARGNAAHAAGHGGASSRQTDWKRKIFTPGFSPSTQSNFPFCRCSGLFVRNAIIVHLASALGKPVWVAFVLKSRLAVVARSRRFALVSNGALVPTEG